MKIQEQITAINKLRDHFVLRIESNRMYELFKSVSQSLETLKTHNNSEDGILVHMNADDYRLFQLFKNFKKFNEQNQ